MAAGQPLLLAHLAATVFMTGAIWIVQVVHYPLFAFVGASHAASYQQRHMRRITWVVGPAMLVEAALAVAVVVVAPRPLAVLSLGLLVVIWLSTALLQVPAHHRLEQGFDRGAHVRLVRTNWIRTAAWTARAVVATLLLMGGA